MTPYTRVRLELKSQKIRRSHSNDIVSPSPHDTVIQAATEWKEESEIFLSSALGLRGGGSLETIFSIAIQDLDPFVAEEVVKVLLVGEGDFNPSPVGTILVDQLSGDKTRVGTIFTKVRTIDQTGDVIPAVGEAGIDKVIVPFRKEEEGGVGHLGSDHLLTPTVWVGPFT
jgi:hypothetical protein